MKLKSLLCLILFFQFSSILTAQPQIELIPFASGLDNPLAIVNADDDRLFIVEQRGLIRILDEFGTILPTPFLDLSGIVSQSGGETGLLGLAFHPQYFENGYFFVNYTREADGTTVVARYSVDEENPDMADAETQKIILTIEQPFGNHNGGQLLFGPAGYLYIFTGDGGSAGDPNNNAQSLNTLLGKILRIDINVDDQTPYAIPDSNPFVEDESALDEIWALGLRNPWRNSFDRYTGDLWIADVGQGELEEVNFQPDVSDGGENYGWRCYEGNLPFNTEGCQDEIEYMYPIFDYEHQGTGCTGAVTGGYVYRGALYSGMFGYYLLADYCTGVFYHVSQTHEGDVSPFIGDFQELEYSSFGEDRYGELYVALRNAGEIRRVVETGDCQPVAWIMEEELTMELEPGETITIQAFYHPTLEYQWNKDDEPIDGESDFTLVISEEGSYSVTVTNPGNECSQTSIPFDVSYGSTSVNPQELQEIKIFPNPVSNQLTIEGLPTEGNTSIILLDITGKTVVSETGINNTTINIPAQSLPEGLYLLRIDHNFDRIVKKVMIKR